MEEARWKVAEWQRAGPFQGALTSIAVALRELPTSPEVSTALQADAQVPKKKLLADPELPMETLAVAEPSLPP